MICSIFIRLLHLQVVEYRFYHLTTYLSFISCSLEKDGFGSIVKFFRRKLRVLRMIIRLMRMFSIPFSLFFPLLVFVHLDPVRYATISRIYQLWYAKRANVQYPTQNQ